MSTLDEAITDSAGLPAESAAPSLFTHMANDVAATRPLKPPPQLYLNRELGQLAFNRRVLAQAADPSTPLLERLKFLCIVSSNLDEFFEIRVAGAAGRDRSGLGPRRVPTTCGRSRCSSRSPREAHALVAAQYRLLNSEVLPALEAEGIRFLRRAEFTPEQAAWIKDYFLREVMPVLTPIGLDPAHPFPRVLNKSLNFAVELQGKDAFGRNSGIAIVQAPRVLPRVIRLPDGDRERPSTISCFSRRYCTRTSASSSPACVSSTRYQFRVTRNSELFVDEEEVKDLRTALRGGLPQRHFGDEVRLEVADNCPPHISDFLLAQFGLERADLYRVEGPVNLVRLMSVPDGVDRPDLKFPCSRPAFRSWPHAGTTCSQAMREGDILLHHPFQSFQPVVEFLQQAARDPNVVAIKQTVYRTGAESELMEILIAAARSGKEVTAVVELMARFDEEANINWAQRLEETGAHVVYGVVGHKTHAKMLIVVRREDGGLRRYVHLSTGNYHARTTKLYTDFGLLTANEEICADVNDVFIQLTGLGKATRLKHLWQSPFTLHQPRAARDPGGDRARAGRTQGTHHREDECAAGAAGDRRALRSLAAPAWRSISSCAACARCGPAYRIARTTSACARSSGRFLEHTRVFYFHNDGAEDVYLSSADWMPRNFFRRVEVCFPVFDPKLKRRIVNEGLTPYLEDNTQAWLMRSDGSYRLATAGEAPPSSAQSLLLERFASHQAS